MMIIYDNYITIYASLGFGHTWWVDLQVRLAIMAIIGNDYNENNYMII